LSQCTRLSDRQTDRQTDGQTDRQNSSLDRVCIPSSAVKGDKACAQAVSSTFKNKTYRKLERNTKQKTIASSTLATASCCRSAQMSKPHVDKHQIRHGIRHKIVGRSRFLLSQTTSISLSKSASFCLILQQKKSSALEGEKKNHLARVDGRYTRLPWVPWSPGQAAKLAARP